MDVFAVGVCLFLLLVGVQPWQSTSPIDQDFKKFNLQGSKNTILKWARIPASHRTISPHLSTELPNEIFDLLDKMLEPNPEKRLTIKECRLHPVFSAPINPSIKSKLIHNPPHLFSSDTLSCLGSISLPVAVSPSDPGSGAVHLGQLQDDDPPPAMYSVTDRFFSTPLELASVWCPITLPGLFEITDGQCLDLTIQAGRPINAGAVVFCGPNDLGTQHQIELRLKKRIQNTGNILKKRECT